MVTRTASCQCGQLTAHCEGEPIRVSVCHCLDCQTRSGSAFAAQARWPDAAVTIMGTAKTWSRTGESGSVFTARFCPDCGSTIAYSVTAQPGIIAIPIGALSGSPLPAPEYSVYEGRKRPWVEITGDVEHFD